MTEKDRQNVLEGCHCAELGGGHFGRDKMLFKIAERFYWRGMVDDVKEFCKTFDKCQRANRYSYVLIDAILCMSYAFLLSALCIGNLTRLLQSSAQFPSREKYGTT